MIRRRIFRPFNVLLTLFACQRHFTCRYSDAILSVKSLAAAVVQPYVHARMHYDTDSCRRD